MSLSQKSTVSPGVGPELKIWTEWHAGGIGLALIAVLSGWPIQFFPIMAAVSFSVLIYRFRKRWTPSGRFGIANVITLARLVGIMLLMSPGNRAGALTGEFALLLFALDGLDGWVARRLRLSSEFGEFFDKEVDAFFLLALCLVLYGDQRLGWWILISGVLRYVFVGYLKFLGPGPLKEPGSRLGRWSYCLMMLSVISAFIIPEAFYRPMVGLTTVVLCLSFADTVRGLHLTRGIVRKSP